MREYKKSSYRGELTNAAIYMVVIFEGLAVLAVVFCIYPWVMEGCSIKYTLLGLAFFKDKSSAMFWLMISTFVFVVYHLKNRGKLFINEENFSQMEVKQGMVIHQRFSYSEYRFRLQSHLTEKFYLTIRVGKSLQESILFMVMIK